MKHIIHYPTVLALALSIQWMADQQTLLVKGIPPRTRCAASSAHRTTRAQGSGELGRRGD